MPQITIYWLDNKEYIGTLELLDDGRIVQIGDSKEDFAMALLGISIESRAAAKRTGTADSEGIIKVKESYPLENYEYYEFIQEILYDYMIQNRRIGGYVID